MTLLFLKPKGNAIWVQKKTPPRGEPGQCEQSTLTRSKSFRDNFDKKTLSICYFYLLLLASRPRSIIDRTVSEYRIPAIKQLRAVQKKKIIETKDN